MKRVFTLALVALIFSVTANAQKRVNASDEFANYNRRSLSMIITKYNDGFDKKFADVYKYKSFDNKYDVNDIETSEVQVSGRFTKDIYFNDKRAGTATTTAVRNKLNHENVGKEILSYLLNRDANGRFNREIIDQRGLWNATDQDVEESRRTEVNMMGQDGEKLIAGSYIVVFDMKNPEEKEKQVKDKDGNVTTKRYWEADFYAYVYRIANAKEVVTNVINNMWIYDTDDEATARAKKQAYDVLQVDLENVATAGSSFYADQLEGAISSSFADLMEELENTIVAWQVATDCVTVRPFITAKIGRKEGLKNGDRYAIYGQVYNKKKHTEEFKRKGYVRATKVANNMRVADGNTQASYFYRISGVERMKGHEILKERKDLGMSVAVNFTWNGNLAEPSQNRVFGSFSMVDLQLAYLLHIGLRGGSQYFLLNFGYDNNSGDNLKKGQEEFGKFGLFNDEDGEFYFKKGISFYNLSIGYMVGLKFWHMMEIQPFFRVGGDMIGRNMKVKEMQDLAKLEDYTFKEELDDKKVKNTYSVFVDPGLRVVFSLWYPVQLYAHVNYSFNIYSMEPYQVINDYLKDCGYGHDKGLGVAAGLRVCF